MFALELGNHSPFIFRRSIHELEFQFSERLGSCRRAIDQRHARSITPTIEHSPESVAQRTELSALRSPVVHHISRVLINYWPQQIGVVARHHNHEVARALQQSNRSSEKRLTCKLQERLVFAHARGSASGKYNSGK